MNTRYLTKEQRNTLIQQAKEKGFEVTDLGNQTWYFQPKKIDNYPSLDDFGPYTCAWITSETTFEYVHEKHDQNPNNFKKEEKEALRIAHNQLEQILTGVVNETTS